MAEDKPKAWRKCRLCFRWFRILVLALVLLFVITAIYLNQVGLPAFAQSILVSKLREKGLDFECERLRWRWYQGIVAESFRLNFSADNDPGAPQVEVGSAVLRVDGQRLRQGEVHINGVRLLDGRFLLPIVETNQPVYELAVEDISTDLVFHPDGTWELKDFSGHSQGLNFDVRATITNAAQLKTLFRRDPNKPKKPRQGIWKRQVRSVADALEQLQFSETPTLEVRLAGDASDTNSLTAELSLTADDVRSPWGSGEDFHLRVPIQAEAGETGMFEAPFEFSATHLHTPWGHLDRIETSGLATQSLTNSRPESVRAVLRLAGVWTEHAYLETAKISASMDLPADRQADLSPQVRITAQEVTSSEYGSVRSLSFDGKATLSQTNKLPRADGLLELFQVETEWATADKIRLSGKFAPAKQDVVVDDSWAWWQKLAPYEFTWDLAATNLASDKYEVQVASLETAGDWTAPRLNLDRLAIQAYRGGVELSTDLDIDTREAKLKLLTTIDPHALTHLLSEKSAKWLAKYPFYTQPPRVQVHEASAQLPEWTRITDPELDWRTEVLPGIYARGNIHTVHGAYKEIRYLDARSTVILSNATFHFPDLVIQREEGPINLEFTSSSLTRQYHFWLDGHINPQDARSEFKTESQQEVFDDLEFTLPPRIHGDIWGRWRHPEETGLDLSLSVTNFAYRGVPFDRLSARVEYTNKVVQVWHPQAVHGGRPAGAEALRVDATADDPRDMRIYFTNVVSEIMPYDFMNVVGPKTAEAISPYQFGQPPLVHLNGSIPLKGTATTDMHFTVSGGPFSWWNFNVEQISGNVDWVTNKLALSSMEGDFYEGKLAGDANFYFKDGEKDADFDLLINFTNANFKPLMADLFNKTNKMSGRLSGRLQVDSATTGDMGSWMGGGNAYLTNGYLWSIPMFGFMSGMLNDIAPGLGKSTVDQGTASFKMTNSVMHTDDMEFRSAAMRLQYRGTIDYQGEVDATVEAQLFRDQGILGKFVRYLATPVTKLFVYRVRGQVDEPEMEPEYIPAFMMKILNPVSLIKGIFSGGGGDKDEKSDTGEKPAEPNTSSPPPR